MIDTKVLEGTSVVANTVVGLVKLVELAEASVESQKLAGEDLAVLWDFRGSKMDLPISFTATHVSGWFKDRREKTSSSRRAFVVRDDKQRLVVEQVMDADAAAPWPWRTFTDLNDALRWLMVEPSELRNSD